MPRRCAASGKRPGFGSRRIRSTTAATYASTSSQSARESWSALRTPSEFERAYLATADPRAQSGFHGSAERWEAARRAIAEAIDSDGTFLDVGCANGLLMESIVEWSRFRV